MKQWHDQDRHPEGIRDAWSEAWGDLALQDLGRRLDGYGAHAEQAAIVVEQTWLSSVKRFGPRHGLGAYAAQVQQGTDGKFHVADPAMRKRVLDLRLDPQASALMAGELTQDHAAAQFGEGRLIET